MVTHVSQCYKNACEDYEENNQISARSGIDAAAPKTWNGDCNQGNLGTCDCVLGPPGELNMPRACTKLRW